MLAQTHILGLLTYNISTVTLFAYSVVNLANRDPPYGEDIAPAKKIKSD